MDSSRIVIIEIEKNKFLHKTNDFKLKVPREMFHKAREKKLFLRSVARNQETINVKTEQHIKPSSFIKTASKQRTITIVIENQTERIFLK